MRNSAGVVATSVHAYGAARRPMAFYCLNGGLLRTIGRRESPSVVEVEIEAETRIPGNGGPDPFAHRGARGQRGRVAAQQAVAVG